WQGLKHFVEAIGAYGEVRDSRLIPSVDRGAEHALAAVAAEPDNAVLFGLLYAFGARYLDLGGRNEQAMELLARAVDLKERTAATVEGGPSELADTYNALGLCHARQGDYAFAEIAFRRALNYNGQLLDAYTNLASVYKAEERFDELRDLLDTPEPLEAL